MANQHPLVDIVERTQIDQSLDTLSDDQVRRLAGLVGAGEEQIPAGLPLDKLLLLLTEVHHVRRKRLIRLLAQAIAQDIHGERKHKKKED